MRKSLLQVYRDAIEKLLCQYGFESTRQSSNGLTNRNKREYIPSRINAYKDE